MPSHHEALAARRADLVAGSYVIERGEGSDAPVAVRITDVLGEEVLIVEPVAGG